MELTRELFASWRNGAEGFCQWVQDVQPQIPSASGKPAIFELEAFQRHHVEAALQTDEQGRFLYESVVLSFPRRHSKTTLAALICLWRFCCFQGQSIVALANSEKQSVSVGFGLAKKIVLQTPFLREYIGQDNIFVSKLELPAIANVFRAVAGNPSALYGEKITVGWVSEVHAAFSDEAMQILASSLGDSENALLLVDSTIDSVGGPLHKLQTLAESGEDPTIYFGLVQYQDLQEALEKSPKWIRRPWLVSRSKQLLPATFSTQHLNQRSESNNSLFAAADIDACMARLPSPFAKDDLTAYAAGRSFVTGGGLDRAYAFSLHGDSTIWTSVAKVATEYGEAEYVVLNQQSIFGSLASGIKKAISYDFKEYALQNTCIESYNSQDIAVWSTENGIPCEIIHATNTNQQPAFLELHRIVKEGRLKFSDKLEDLKREMQTFQYEIRKGQPYFGSDKFHDDRVYSLAWAVHSLRQKELAAYTLRNIICDSKSNHANLCYLRAGDAILACSAQCQTHIQCLMMYQQYKAMRPETDFTLPTFYKSLVKVHGVRIIT